MQRFNEYVFLERELAPNVDFLATGFIIKVDAQQRCLDI